MFTKKNGLIIYLLKLFCSPIGCYFVQLIQLADNFLTFYNGVYFIGNTITKVKQKLNDLKHYFKPYSLCVQNT